MKRTYLLIAFFFGLISVLSVIQVAASNRISTAGIELQNLESQIADIKRQNTLIQEKVLTLSSLNRIASKAGEMGFVEAKSNIYISQPLPLASR